MLRSPSKMPAAIFSLLVLFVCLGDAPVAAMDSSLAKQLFAEPPRDYSTGPLWVWNDLLSEAEIRETMRDLAGQNVRQVFVHPRPGLITPYLSEDWFRLWKIALDQARQLDMNVWIYDENSYPSGFAGGWVPEVMPESRGRGLFLREVKAPPQWTHDLLAVYRLEAERFDDVTKSVRAGGALPEGRYLAAAIQRAGNSPWHGGRSYVDLLYPGVTEKFLDLTLEAYRREIGPEFGKRVPGVFTDEPNIRPAGGLPWTEGLPAEFQKRWGYNLLDHLPSLTREVGDWRKVRHNYFQVLLEQFVAHWARPYHDYCARHGLEMTGHYWEHEWPNCLVVPDNMAMYAWEQRPAIDCLMNQYSEGPHAQFGNARAVKELSSVANQLGLKRTLCEVYGAGGWDLRFEDMKRIGDWLEVLGVNTLDQHLSYVTIRGARKRDHPQSFSYHEPWWDAYHVPAGYFSRLSAALSQGEQINRILLLEPTTTAWMYNSETENHPRLKEIGESFQRLVLQLENAQIEYDIGCEDILAGHGTVRGRTLIVGRAGYDTLILPPLTENLNAKTIGLLEKFVANGGRVFCCGEPPSRVDGVLSDRGIVAARNESWRSVEPAEVAALLRSRAPQDGFSIERLPDDKGILFHHRRQLDDGELLFLANTSAKSVSRGSIASRARGLEQWDPETGEVTPVHFDRSADGVRARFDIPPCGSLLLFLSKATRKPAPLLVETTTTLVPLNPPGIGRLEPNVLTLDYVDVTAGGEKRTNLYFYQASQFVFQKNGMDRNPWDSAVQFRDELVRKTFPADSGFEATYRFVIEEKVPGRLFIVIERPDLYAIACNGRPVVPEPGAWWLDKAFGRIDIAGLARVGDNAVTIKASPFTIYHELESAYLLGDFVLKPAGQGFIVAPDRGLHLGRWNQQGLPFYSSGVAYREDFKIDRTSGRYRVHLPGWYGSVAKISVNGESAGVIASQPWQCDVTRLIRNGTNSVEVVVIGTLKNTLGPHHGNPALGTAWPGMFQRAPNPGPPPGEQYDTVGYGLFAPFFLKHLTEEPVTTVTSNRRLP